MREIQLQCHTAKTFNYLGSVPGGKQIQQQNRAQHDRDSHQIEGTAERDIESVEIPEFIYKNSAGSKQQNPCEECLPGIEFFLVLYRICAENDTRNPEQENSEILCRAEDAENQKHDSDPADHQLEKRQERSFSADLIQRRQCQIQDHD